MQTSSAPAISDRFSQVYGLGSPVSYFPVKSLNQWISAVLALLLLSGGAITFLYGIYDTYVETQRFGPAVMERTFLTPLIISVILIIIGAALGITAFSNWGRAVVVYEQGLAFSTRNDVGQIRWNEVDEFYFAITKRYTNGIYTGTSHIYTIRKPDGSRVKFDDRYKQVETLGKTIGRSVAPLQYQKLVQTIKSGQSAKLGPIVINHDTISLGKKVFSWAEIEQVGIQRGYVSIKKKDGGWFSGATTPVAAIPNLDALMAVIDQVVGVKAK